MQKAVGSCLPLGWIRRLASLPARFARRAGRAGGTKGVQAMVLLVSRLWRGSPLAACFLSLVSYGQDARSDTFDITHIHLSLDLSDIPGENLIGHAKLMVHPKISQPSVLSLDLLKLTVDSVRIDGSPTVNFYNDTLLEIPLPSFTTSDTFLVEVFYQGTPVTDATGWGGFFFQGSYAYNIGVGFAADPHNFGRVWFPCFDNFIEKSPYSMSVITLDPAIAVCSGGLDSSSGYGPGKTIWHYSMEEPIPSYLASVAVAPFKIIEWLYDGQAADVPVRVSALDTTKVSTTFVNLLGAMAAFENAYGPVMFDRVGYCIVPFSGGAMEHPTNIAYPTFAMTGNTQYESLMTHELSHHWWGDQVTCSTPEDMWINEGWASYSVYLFDEHVYGHDRYVDEVRANHRQVVQFTHVRDDGYRAVSGVPHEYTYGSTVYDKGAEVAHTLRGYLGDSLFFGCIRSFFSTSGFASVSSGDFRDYLSSCSGMDMSSFFDNWVFNPGFPHFSIDSVMSTWDGFGYKVDVFARQRLDNAPAYYDNVPLDVTFIGSDFQTTTEQLIMSGRCGIYHTWLNYDPAFVALDMNERISDAITDEVHVFTSPGDYDFTDALMDVTVSQFSGDSILLRVEHNYVPPDRMKQPIPGLILSDYRYWKVDGVWSGDIDASATIKYNGTTSTSTGHLDNGLITNSEDSLLLMYRSSPKDDWRIYADYTLNTQGSTSNKVGIINITKLIRGEYALAILDHDRTDTIQSDIPTNCADLNVGMSQLSRGSLPFDVYPNPVEGTLRLRIGPVAGDDSVEFTITSPAGTVVRSGWLKPFAPTEVATREWPSGWYVVTLRHNGEQLGSSKVLVVH